MLRIRQQISVSGYRLIVIEDKDSIIELNNLNLKEIDVSDQNTLSGTFRPKERKHVHLKDARVKYTNHLCDHRLPFKIPTSLEKLRAKNFHYIGPCCPSFNISNQSRLRYLGMRSG